MDGKRKVAFLDDKVVFAARFEPENQALAGFEFSFVPLTGAQMAKVQQGMAGGPVAAYETAVKVVGKHVVRWGLIDDDTEIPSPQDEAGVKRLEHSLLIGIATKILDSVSDGEAAKGN